MFREIFRFEVKYNLGQPLYYISVGVFFLAGLGLASSDLSVAFVDAPGSVARNAPYVIVQLMPILSLLGLFSVTAFVAGAVLRDNEHGSEALFFTRPISNLAYLGGRFAGSIAVSLTVLLAAMLGLALGGVAPWQDAARIAPFSIAPYLFGLLVIVLHNLLTMGALFFAVAIWSRRLGGAYLGVVLYIGLQDLVEILARDFTGDVLGGLLEPSGLYAIELSARYWTNAEFALLVPELSGTLLANRLAWLLVGVLAFVAGYWRFAATRLGVATRSRASKRAPEPPIEPRERAADTAIQTLDSRPVRDFSFGMRCRQLALQTRLETAETLGGSVFLVSIALFVLFLILSAGLMGQFRGTPAFPQTQLMLRVIGAVSAMVLPILMLFLAGESLHRERSLSLDGIYDSLPLPNWVSLGAKLCSVVLVVTAFLAAAVVCTLGVQQARGFEQLQPGLYAKGLGIVALPLLLCAVLFFFLQVVANHRLIGLLLGTLFLLTRFASRFVGLENNLYRYAAHPPIPYSDMNGYGGQTAPFLWFGLYWSLGAAVLLGLSLLFWVRGTERGLGSRLRTLRGRWRPPIGWWIASTMAAFIVVGSFIHYHTGVLKESTARARRVERLVRYEKRYRQYEELDLPRVRAVRAEVDIFPRTRQVEIRGSFELENDGSEPIRRLPITLSPRWVEGIMPVYGGVTLGKLDPGDHQVLVADTEVGFFLYELAEALLPGEKRTLEFEVSVDQRGFRNQEADYLVVGNGTFFTNRSFFPLLGYAESNELLDPEIRRRNALPPPRRMRALEEIASEKRSYLGTDWVRFETVLSTSADQIAIAPGDLVAQWEEGERRYFRYQARAPIVDLLSFHSGRYEVARDRWNGVDLEVYYHRGHPYNIERFLRAAKLALEYCSENFGPYPHPQLRIVEIPSYHGELAVSLAQTIAYSASWGFVAEIGAGPLDHLTWLTAHEVAHQWWNHQLVPGNVQGATLLAESLAEYSALMVMEKEYGEAFVRRFLRYQLDGYLAGRGRERQQEMPLLRVENQGYIHYFKGGHALYALKDYIGEQRLNRALERFLASYAFQGPPYPTSRELVEALREVTPPELDHLIEDLFETITLFDNRVLEASYSRQDDGLYRVRVRTSSRKLKADGKGGTTQVPIDDWIDVGVFGWQEVEGVEQESVLVLEKRKITEMEMEFEFTVSQQPRRAGIDPYNRLIDRNSDDNLREIEDASTR